MIYNLSILTQRVISFVVVGLIYATCMHAETYGTYHQFVQVQRILSMVDEIVREVPPAKDDIESYLELGERGIKGLWVYDNRPKGLMLKINSSQCQLCTPWGSILLFKDDEYQTQTYYLATFEQLCKKISIEFSHFLSSSEFYYGVKNGERILLDANPDDKSDKWFKGTSSIIISEFSYSFYNITQINKTVISPVKAFFPYTNDYEVINEYEAIKAEWHAYETQYSEEPAFYKDPAAYKAHRKNEREKQKRQS